jgi:hypothetical protein
MRAIAGDRKNWSLYSGSLKWKTMKHLISFFLYVLSVILCHPAFATNEPTLFTETKTLPSDVRAQMPRSANSLRFDSHQFTATDAPILLHLYKIKDVGYLDLFQRGGKLVKPKETHKTLIRLNSLRLSREQDVNPTSGSFSACWLDPKERQIPIIKIEANGGSGFGGLWFLYVFPQGLEGKAIKQTFDFTFGINGTYRSVEFGEIDEQRLVTIQQTDGFTTSTDMTPEQIEENEKRDKTVILHWDVNEFVAENDPSIVHIKASVGIGNSAIPVVLLARALEKDTTSNRFRLSWDFVIAGDVASSTALYDRQRHTLKFYSMHQEITGYKYITNYLYSKVTDDAIQQLAAKYRIDEDTITDTSFIQNLTEFGCQSQDLGVSK